MTILSRLRAHFDAPRFCPDCGKPIRVDNRPTYDPTTGESRDQWVWRCPDVRLTVTHHGIVRAEQQGLSVHRYGDGKPRWSALDSRP